jgi:hypothetical protein
MAATHPVSVAGTGVLQGEFREILISQHPDIFPDRLGLCLKNLDTKLVQFSQRARTDTPDHDCIDVLIVQGFQRIARAMRMMLVFVIDRCYGVAVRLDNEEGGC